MTYIEVDLQYLQDNSNLCRLTEVLSLNLKKFFVITKFVLWYLPERYSSMIPESRECGWSGIASHLAGQFSEVTLIQCLLWNEIVRTLLYFTPNLQYDKKIITSTEFIPKKGFLHLKSSKPDHLCSIVRYIFSSNKASDYIILNTVNNSLSLQESESNP